MKKLLFGFLLIVLSNFAQAGYFVDSWKTASPQEVCSWAATEVGNAIDRRLRGVPFIIKDKSEMPRLIGRNTPTDALYIADWDNLDDIDKEFLTKFLRFGYDLAEKKLAVMPEARFPQDFGDEYQKFMATCMTHKNNREEIFQQIRVGFNEALFMCNELKYDLAVISESITNGISKEAVLDRLSRSSSQLRQDRMERILKQINEAYAYKGPIENWVYEQYKECVI